MRFKKTAGILLAAGALALVSTGVEAQRHGRAGRHYHPRSSIRAYGYYYTPYLGFYYGPFFGPTYYSPYYYAYSGPPYYAPPYSGGGSLRIQVKPVETEVYVDGYYAGVVDDFDGFFQRLRLPPGEHEIELYLEGHKSVRKALYLSPGSTYKIRTEMQPLGPGEAEAPRPGPVEPPPEQEAPPEGAISVPSGQAAPEGEANPPPSSLQSQFGVLALRVQPAGATLLIDGERWPVAENWEQLILHLSAGQHRVELQQEGHEPFGIDAEVRVGQRTDLNVRLSPNEVN